MEFLLKIKCSDALRMRDVIKDIQAGLHLIVGGGDPDCEYLEKLSQVKIIEHKRVKKIPRVTK